jgi:hypothetical protein
MNLVKNIILYSNISFQLSLIFLLLVDKIGNLAAARYVFGNVVVIIF